MKVFTEKRVKVWAFKGEHVLVTQKGEERAEPGALGRGVARDEVGLHPCPILGPYLVGGILVSRPRAG